jgi:hypothetical protein
MAGGTCMPVQRGQGAQLCLLPPSFAAARALAGLSSHLVWNHGLPVHGMPRMRNSLARTTVSPVHIRRGRLHAYSDFDLRRSAEYKVLSRHAVLLSTSMAVLYMVHIDLARANARLVVSFLPSSLRTHLILWTKTSHLWCLETMTAWS